ncbi:hypothetical protein EGY25_08900 [Brevundimonas intermedia]|uniref:Uncharacterized protein n=2 Tax=Brevundimonas intermedia TaxID=74315 RepID=A0A4Y9RSA0_9CAUL|nr:hypothetical protein EGY25_08900 [Brevundimonas intermedia]
MDRFLLLVILCVGLAVLRAVAIVLIASVVLGLVVSFITRPKQTLVFLGTLTLSALTVAQPIACIVAMTTFGIAVVLARRRRNRSSERYLNAPH